MSKPRALALPAALLLAACSPAPQAEKKDDTGPAAQPAVTPDLGASSPAAQPPETVAPEVEPSAPMATMAPSADDADAMDVPDPDDPAESLKLQQEYFGTQDSDRRSEIIFELSDLDTPSAVQAVTRLLQSEPSTELKAQLLMAYGEMDAPAEQKLQVLSPFLTASQPLEIRENAVEALDVIDDARALPLWHALLNDPDEDIRDTATAAIERIQQPPAPDDE